MSEIMPIKREDIENELNAEKAEAENTYRVLTY